jgi:hypothetical protein
MPGGHRPGVTISRLLSASAIRQWIGSVQEEWERKVSLARDIINIYGEPPCGVSQARCTAERRDPGGGGISVARVMKWFGADVMAMYPAGGAIGQ